MYVSFEPPMIAIAEHPGSRTCKLIQRSGAFSVSFLHAAQQDIAERAGHSAEGTDKFAALKIRAIDAPADAGGAPAVAGSIARLAVSDLRYARVDALRRYRRRYAHIGHETSVEAPEGYPT